MRRRKLGRALLGVSVTLAMAAGGVTLLPAPAGANGPTKYGWWYKANSGLPVTPPPPAQVPSGGLYVENGFNGPTAISALTFTVPSGSQLGPLTLKVAGSPTITQAPLACALSPASADYKPAEDGSWGDRPSYDCNKAQITGSVDSNKTTVTFNADPFLANGNVAVVILAGGSIDQIAFQKPDDSTLQITSGDVGSGAAAAVTPDVSDGATGLPAQPSGAGASQSPVDTGAGPLLSNVPAPGAPVTPAGPGVPGSATAATPSGGDRGAGSPGYLGAPSAAIIHPAWHTKVATALGLTAVLLALVAWTLGYGPLGGRVQPLSVRLRPPPGPPREEQH